MAFVQYAAGQVRPKRQQEWLGAGQIFLSNFSENDEIFGVPENHSARALKLKIFGPVLGPLEKVCRNLYMKPMPIFDTDFKVFRAHTSDRQTHKQTRTSYLGTGVAD